MTDKVIPFSLKNAPSLIEHVFPVQRLSSESYKEQMAVHGKTLTALGSYWKGRKPLVLNRACILAALLPSTKNLKKDLKVFELLMGMDDESVTKRNGNKFPVFEHGTSYKNLISKAKRVEEMPASFNSHIWNEVNTSLGTNARNINELVYQLGIMRYGHRPIIADTFSGSGQIPFEAARIGCDVYASDLNPIACLLTWGAFNIVGASDEKRQLIEQEQSLLVSRVKSEIDEIGVELDGNGWRGKVYLYCLEVLCPTSGWLVPVLPSLVVSEGKKVVAQLVPNAQQKRYEIVIKSGVSDAVLSAAKKGTYQNQSIVHRVDGIEHINKISSIRGDYFDETPSGKVSKNALRQWVKSDIEFSEDDVFHERLFAIQWIKDDNSSRPLTEFRGVTQEDIEREQKVSNYVKNHLNEWQENGWIPEMVIEPGYNTSQPIWERGWTYWHHLFNPRHLLTGAIIAKQKSAFLAFPLTRVLNRNSRLSLWDKNVGGGGATQGVFMNQALNTTVVFGARGVAGITEALSENFKSFPIDPEVKASVINEQAQNIKYKSDIFVTDPPYGDAVKYEEIYEFFIAWLKGSPPDEFKNWVWDSRRALAIKGEDHDFKLAMVSAYKHMADSMPDNGLQIIMFTHQSGSIWADMANIVWASGLKVSAAWYIVTETDSALRDGQYVKGTILLVLRKRGDSLESYRDELAYEIKEEVEKQVEILTGLNLEAKDLYKYENLFEDADIQMAGYAAALRVLTRYSTIDGVNMANESLRPRVKGQKTLVDDLIDFAVEIANQYLVPDGLKKEIWDNLSGAERFYCKMMDMESKGINSLSNYQNFAKAFKVSDFSILLGETKANKTELKTAELFGKRGMGGADEFGTTNIRNVLYAIYLLIENKIGSDDVLHQLKELVPDFYRKRDLLIAIADYISKKTSGIREKESQSARILRDLIRNERA